jgi:hypothetical protein
LSMLGPAGDHVFVRVIEKSPLIKMNAK